jgi:hypothetical protein
MIISLLKSDLVRDKNLLFPKPANPLNWGGTPNTIMLIGGVGAGEAFRHGCHQCQKTSRSSSYSTMAHLDKLMMDHHGQHMLLLEPVCFTLTLFNLGTAAWNSAKAWHPPPS